MKNFMEKYKINKLVDKYYYLLIFFFSVLFFISLYGYKIINPFYVEWINIVSSSDWQGDLYQHYVGWQAYRFGNWVFPLGVTNYLSYPYYISVIFTDSIPLLAFIFKLLSFLLPKKFQYFEMYGLFCFILQSFFAFKIIKKYTDSKLNIIFGSLFFILSPVMIRRVFYHTALASQWILLLSLETLFLYDSFEEGKKIYYIWGSIAFLCVGIHFYFLLMCGMILLGYCLLDVLKTKKIFKSIKLLIIYLLSGIVTTFVFGGFIDGSKLKDTQWGYFAFNLNGLFNPYGISSFVNDLTNVEGNYEGFAYLGIGGIILLIVAAVILFMWILKKDKKITNNKELLISLGFISLISLFFSLSPKVYFGKKLIYNLKLPSFIDNLWFVFRSTGRFIWPVVYILFLGSIIIVIKKYYWKKSLFLILLCLFINMCEFGEYFDDIYNMFDSVTNGRYIISEKYDIYNYHYLKEVLKNKEVKLLVFASKFDGNGVRTFYVSYSGWALNNGLKTNRFHFVRRSLDQYGKKSTKKYLKNIDNSKIYLFFDGEECSKYKLYCYDLPDGNYLGYSKELE